MTSWTDSLSKTRYVWDVVLLIFFVLANVPQIGLAFHEWISFVYILPFILHLLLHWDWMKTVPIRIFQVMTGETRFNVIWDVALYLMMVFVILSGILASEVVLPLFGEFKPQPFWTQLHNQTSNILIMMVGVHLAMHWSWIKDLTRRMRAKRTPVKAAENLAE